MSAKFVWTWMVRKQEKENKQYGCMFKNMA